MRDIITKILLLLMVVGVLYYAMHITRPSKFADSAFAYDKLQSISAAISGLVYGLDGYRGYGKVLSYFQPVHFGSTADNEVLNGLIQQALNIDDIASSGIHYVWCDLGLVDYFKLAFVLFGYRVQSTSYFFGFIVGVSAITLMFSFYRKGRDTLCWFVLLVTVCGLVVVGPTYFVLNDHHYFAVMAFIPSIHIALMAIDKGKLTALKIAGVVLQAVLLIFIIFARSSAAYQIMFLATWLVFLMARNMTRKKAFLDGIYVWPLVLVLFFFGTLQIYKKVATDKLYSGPSTQHPFWHNLYMGLGAHPDAGKKYGIDNYADIYTVWMVVRKLGERGIPYNFGIAEQVILRGLAPEEGAPVAFDALFENTARKEYIRLLIKDPRFVLGSFLYKIKYYFLTCFTDGKDIPTGVSPPGSTGAWKNMTQWYLLATVALGAFLVRNSLCLEWPLLLILAFLEWLFSLIPYILVFPSWSYIGDSVVALCVLIYMVFAVVLSHLFCSGEKLLKSFKKPASAS